jgi:UDP-N-acetylglucosamine transferase subunit ALG13
MSGPVLLVAVGTDWHPFTRLVGWVDRWLEAQGPLAPRTFVQYGSSPAPRQAEGAAFLSHGDMQRLLADTRAVICHGGPATILEARRTGHLPIVVPRDPRLGEHVDDHQQRFARRLAEEGLIVMCESKQRLYEALDTARSRPEAFRLGEGDGHVMAPGVQRAGELIEAVLTGADRRARGRQPGVRRRLWLR